MNQTRHPGGWARQPFGGLRATLAQVGRELGKRGSNLAFLTGPIWKTATNRNRFEAEEFFNNHVTNNKLVKRVPQDRWRLKDQKKTHYESRRLTNGQT